MAFSAKCIWVGWLCLDTPSAERTPLAGAVLPAMSGPPAQLQGGFQTPWKSPTQQKCQHPAVQSCRVCLGGSRVEAGREVHHMPCLQILLRLLLEEETAFGLIYISATLVTAAHAESWLVVRHSSTALVFPAAPTTPERRMGRVLCLPCSWQGQSCMETSCCTSCGCGKGCKASSLLFLSDCGQPDRSHLKGRGWEGGTQRVGT